MSSLVLMALGVFRFGMSGPAYQTMSRQAEYRWEQVDRIGRAPAAQFGGPGTEAITIEGVIYPAFRGGLRQLDVMRARAGTGVPMMMVDGLGFVWKRWVMVSVTETKSHFLAGGAPRKIEFELELQSYGEDAWRLF